VANLSESKRPIWEESQFNKEMGNASYGCYLVQNQLFKYRNKSVFTRLHSSTNL